MIFIGFRTFLRIFFLIFASVCVAKCFVIGSSKNSTIVPPSLPVPSFGFIGFGGEKTECLHSNTTYGSRENGDLQMFVEKVKKDKLIFRKTTVQVKYPSGKTQNDCVITYIVIENLLKECKCYGTTLDMKGGVGSTYFELYITSEANCPIERRISCYTKC